MATMRAKRAGLTLADLSLVEKMALVSGWLPSGQGGPHPGRWASCRWRDWAAYLHDYQQVEAELRQHFKHLKREPFAARALAYQRRHGIEALTRGAYEQIRGDDAD